MTYNTQGVSPSTSQFLQASALALLTQCGTQPPSHDAGPTCPYPYVYVPAPPRCVDITPPTPMDVYVQPDVRVQPPPPPPPPQDARPIGPTPNDRDGDGFRTEIDCDDDNPVRRPLIPNAVNIINSNISICPGTYGGANLVVAGDDITIDAMDVRGVAYSPISNRRRITINNLSWASAGPGPSGGLVSDSQNIRFNNFRFTVDASLGGPLAALTFTNSSDCVINGGLISGAIGSRTPVRVVFNNSSRSRIEGVTFTEDTELVLTNADANTIVGNTFRPGGAGGVFIESTRINITGNGNEIVRNMVTGYDPHTVLDIYTGIYVSGNGNRVRDNMVGAFHRGIHVYAGRENIVGENNQVTGCDWAGMTIGGPARGRMSPPTGNAMGTIVVNNRSTVNSGIGIGVFTSGNTLRNNTLTGNTGGNLLNCGQNTCSGNIER